MRLNFELNLDVVDVATGAAMRQMFERDLSEARAVLPFTWCRRPLWQKSAERAAGLLARDLGRVAAGQLRRIDSPTGRRETCPVDDSENK